MSREAACRFRETKAIKTSAWLEKKSRHGNNAVMGAARRRRIE
jgi:hypothetical protein